MKNLGKVERVVYAAADGKEFLSEKACLRYEKSFLIRQARKELLDEMILKEIANFPGLIEIGRYGDSYTNVHEYVYKNLHIDCYPDVMLVSYKTDEPGKLIPCSDNNICPFDKSKFGDFISLIKGKYLYSAKVPAYYW